MSTAFFPPGWQIPDADGNPLAGGKYKFYSAQTTTPKAVYSDADLVTPLGTEVNFNSAGVPVAGDGTTPVLVYFATGDYKVEIIDANGVLKATFDDIPGADPAAVVDPAATPETPVISKTSTYSILVADQGKLINANPTGGSFAITLPSAITAGDGFRIGVRHDGTSNTVSILSVLSQAIKHQKSSTSFPLLGYGETAWFVSNGADWLVDTYVPPYLKAPLAHIQVQDRITAPPASPTAGAAYIITGTPTGVWNTLGFAQHDVAIADGNGSWMKFTPQSGWLAFIVTGGVRTEFKSGAWSDYTNITAPATSALKVLVVADEKAQNTGAGTATTGAWTKHTLNTVRNNTMTGASLSSDQVTLPTGKYKITALGSYGATFDIQMRWKSTSTSTVITGPSLNINRDVGGGTISTQSTLQIVGYFEVAGATEIFELQYYAQSAGGLGEVRNISGEVEVYRTVLIEDLTSQQGPVGATGAQGSDGLDAAYALQFSTSTSGDPGSGKIGANNATLASATVLNISKTGTYGDSLANIIPTWDDSTSTIKARIKFQKEGATQNFALYSITGTVTDNTTYYSVPVGYVAGGGTLANADNLAVLVVEKGDKGDPGAASVVPGPAGPTVGVSFNYSTTTTDSDPGSGNFRLNNATPASATAAYFDNNERGGTDVSAWLDTFDDSGDSTLRGYLLLIDPNASTTFYVYAVSGSVVDGTGYRKLTLAYVAGGGTFTNGAQVIVSFAMRGATGSGDLSSLNNLSDVASLKSSLDNLSVHGSDVASAGTINLETATGYLVDVTGTTTITAITLSEGHKRFVRFTGALTLTHGASLVLPGAANITTAAGDFAIFVGYAAGVVRCLGYFRTAGRTLNSGVPDTLTKGFSATSYSAGTFTTGTFAPDPANGNFQHATNNGAHTLAPPSSVCTMVIEYLNGASANAITTSGFTKVDAGAYNTTNTNKFLFYITKSNSYSSLVVVPLQ